VKFTKYTKKQTRSAFIGLMYTGIVLQSGIASADDDHLFDMSLKQLMQIKIQSSTFFDRTAAQSPGSSWVFTQKELVNSPIEYVKDIFEFYAPATTVSQQTFTGSSTGVRGIATDNNAKTIFMYDGQSLNQKTHYGYQAGLQSTLFGDIERVEIIHGPGAMLHGSGAINGIINVIPKNGKDYAGFHSKLNYGTKEKLKKAELGYGASYGENKYFYIYGGIAEAGGFAPDSFLELDEPYTNPTDPNINRNHHTYVLKDNYRVAAYLTHDNWNLQSQFQRVFRSRNQKESISNNNFFSAHWQTMFASRLKYTTKFQTKSTFEISMPIEFFDFGVTSNSPNGDKAGSENHIALKAIMKHELGTEHKLAYGVGVGRRNFQPLKQYFESDRQLPEESLDGSLSEVEIFAEDIWDISDSLSILFGVRYDHVNYSTFTEPETGNFNTISPKNLSATTYRLALSKEINEKQTFKVSYQEGFRYPDVAYYLTHGLANNELEARNLEKLIDLKPETVKSYEINYLHELAEIPMTWELNLYYNIHEGTLDFKNYSVEELGQERYDAARAGIGFGPGAFSNAQGKFNAYGFEILNRWQPSKKISIRSSYGYSRPSSFDRAANDNLFIVNETDSEWASYPEHLFKLAYDQEFYTRFTLNVTTYYASSTNICVSNCAVSTATVRFHQQDRIRVNSKIQYHFDKKTTFAFTVQNLFKDDGPPVGRTSIDGLGKESGLGDDARRFYLSVGIIL